jgi:hypothetical protein
MIKWARPVILGDQVVGNIDHAFNGDLETTLGEFI